MELEKRAIENIELDKVLNDIALNALSSEGRAMICADAISDDESIIEHRYETVDTYMNYLDGASPLSPFPDLSSIFHEAESSHRDLSGLCIRDAGEYLNSYFIVMEFLKRSEDVHEEDRVLSSDILSSLDSDGSVTENHPRLLPLIKAREEFRRARLSFSEHYIAKNRSFVQNSNPLYKNERVVIPVRSDQRLEDECYISGQSQSGATLFAEPFELVELNNKVVLAEERIRTEKLKIIHDLSERVRLFVPILSKLSRFIAEFDFHYSLALWARKNKAAHPQLGSSLSMLDARHPLLGKKAVPITIKLENQTKVLVLSGANAGGKTVTMKTIALNAALFQLSGFALLNELSSMVIFSQILTDIGDGQSIADSASTFSSHMGNISDIMRKSDSHTLVLLDELGSGTDPEEGAALSVAILKYLAVHSFLTLTTSHYGAVKNYAYSAADMTNASMEFDERSGRPTYRVLEGIPGDSYAIAAAKRALMPKQVIADAESILGNDRTTSASIITGLLSKSRTLDRKITEAEIRRKTAEEKERIASEREEKLERKMLELEKSGYKELNEYIKESRSELEKLLKNGRNGIEKDKANRVRGHLDNVVAKRDEIEKHISMVEDKYDEKDAKSFSIGDDVLCSDAKMPGRIIEDRGRGRYFVALENGLRMEIKSQYLIKAPSRIKAEVSHYNSAKKAEYEMDLRGLTLAEALKRLDDQIEASILNNLSSFSIIHGYGDGILSRGIHDYLKKRREVSDYRFALPEDGGMGKTYVMLNL